MNRLWAPWRINYVRGNKPQGHGLASGSQSQKRTKGCIFCLAKKSASRDYVIFKSEFTIVMLNIYPYNNGHLLVSPLRHIRDISQLREEEILDLFECLNKAKALLQKVLQPQGYNIGLNLTRTAGAGITGHLHIHIVPRWEGDTNFMPVLSNTKIISQSLDDLAKSLKNADK